MTTVTLDNIPETRQAEYQLFFRTLAREYDLDELEDTLLGIHMSHNTGSVLPISDLRTRYASHLS